jgi:hypothetical protein
LQKYQQGSLEGIKNQDILESSPNYIVIVQSRWASLRLLSFFDTLPILKIAVTISVYDL